MELGPEATLLPVQGTYAAHLQARLLELVEQQRKYESQLREIARLEAVLNPDALESELEQATEKRRETEGEGMRLRSAWSAPHPPRPICRARFPATF